jgi:CHASE1-domain containing sensor protein
MSIPTDGFKRAMPYRQFMSAVLVAVIGTAVTLGFFCAAHSAKRHRIRAEFDSLADDRFHAVANMIASTSKLLSFTDDVFQVGPRADSPEFTNYLRSLEALLKRDLAGHLELNGLTWLPRVSPGKQAAYEHAAQEVFDPHFRLHGPDASADKADKGKDAQPADCFPCYLCLGKTELRGRLGEDLSLDPAMWEVMQRARDTGAMVASAPMKLSDDATYLGYRVFAPLYANDDPGNAAARRETNTGFLCVDLAVGELVEIAFKNLVAVGVDVHWIDDTDKSRVDVCRHLSRLQLPTVCTTGECPSDELESSWTSDFFERKLLLRCVSTSTFWERHTVWEPWVLLFGGLALTLVGSVHQLSLALRANSIERVVNTRLAAIQREAAQRR